MKILIKSALILDPKSEYHNKKNDILIDNGVIKKIAESITEATDYHVIKKENLHVSKGWFDSSVCFGEPGFEDRETIQNGLKTAASSGFTDVCVNPNTNPIIDTNSDVVFLKNKANNHACNLHPIAAVTKNSDGIDLAEIYDMQQAGAVAFGDYNLPISNPNLLKIALQYAQNCDALVLSFPQNNDIKGKGVVNEEETATKLGLKGIPALAEALQIARDLQILEYTGGKLHIPTISTVQAVRLIADAKKRGLDVTCSVAVHHLVLTDSVLENFDTNYKVLPPLRTREDRKALLKGVIDGTIDFITSDHNPIDIEHKQIEFDHAKYGTLGLESAFGALNAILETNQVIEKLTSNKSRFNIEEHSIAVNEQANLTLFNPENNYIFTKEHIVSKSKNSAFLGLELKGHVYGVINNNQVHLNE